MTRSSAGLCTLQLFFAWTVLTHFQEGMHSDDVPRAVKVQQAMSVADFVPTDTVWGSLMVACGKAGQLESALRLWQGFKEARVGLQNVKNPEPCVGILIACGQTYQLQPALAILSEMKQAGMSNLHRFATECLLSVDHPCFHA